MAEILPRMPSRRCMPRCKSSFRA